MKKIVTPDDSLTGPLQVCGGQFDVFIGEYQRVGYVISARDSGIGSEEAIEVWRLRDDCHLDLIDTLRAWGGLDEPTEFISPDGQTVAYFIPERQSELDNYDRFDEMIRPEVLNSFAEKPWEGKCLTDLMNRYDWPAE